MLLIPEAWPSLTGDWKAVGRLTICRVPTNSECVQKSSQAMGDAAVKCGLL